MAHNMFVCLKEWLTQIFFGVFLFFQLANTASQTNTPYLLDKSSDCFLYEMQQLAEIG